MTDLDLSHVEWPRQGILAEAVARLKRERDEQAIRAEQAEAALARAVRWISSTHYPHPDRQTEADAILADPTGPAALARWSTLIDAVEETIQQCSVHSSSLALEIYDRLKAALEEKR